jgi:hypothetical protein
MRQLKVKERQHCHNVVNHGLTIDVVAIWSIQIWCNLLTWLPNCVQIWVPKVVSMLNYRGIGESFGFPYRLLFPQKTNENPVFESETGLFFRVLLPNCCKMVELKRTQIQQLLPNN